MSATRVIDSHTGGEPTRVVVAGGPDFAGRAPAAARQWLQREQDAWRRAIACEPRGNDVVVGAYLLPPTRSDCVAGVVFFNNVGYLGMCGHGTIGVAQTLLHLGRIQAGKFQLETPVGVVEVELAPDGRVTIANVASYRHARQVALDVPGLGRVHGDIAWGGNWFFLVDDHGLAVAPDNIEALMRASSAIRRALDDAGIGGRDGGVIDHVELLAGDAEADSRNFVLCPGFAYDRSPCGTGTSAKLACLAAEGKLAEGAVWRQRSVIGSEFQAWYRRLDEQTILPCIAGRAHVVAEAVLHFDPADPFAWGLA